MLSRLVSALACVLLLLAFQVDSAQAQSSPAAGAASPAANPQPAYRSNPKFEAAMAAARKLDAQHQFPFAADAYRKANKLAGGRCLECLIGLYGDQMTLRDFKEAANTASVMEQIAGSPIDKSVAEMRHADALYGWAGDKPKPDKLEAVHGLLQEAIAAYPQNAPALFLDGNILARLGKLDDAREEFTKCVSCVNPRDPGRLRAEHFAQDPELALHKMAPLFEVTALDGSKFNLDAMDGRVVLIDFWATWCPSCVEEVPYMKRIAKEFAGEPLVIISVSWDSDEQKWKDYVAKNGMTWVQYRDADHKLAEAFGINSIPHYFTIDSDGVLTSEMVGEGSDVEGKLKKLIAKAKEAQQQTLAAAPTGNHRPGS